MEYIKQTKFSESIVSFRFIVPFEKETITAYNILCYMLKSKTEEFENKQQMAHVFNKNYGMKMSVGLSVYGQSLSLQLQFRFIRSDWIQKESYGMSLIHIIDQFLFHPVFTMENLKESQYLLKNRIQTQMDDPFTLSVLSALQIISNSHSISIPTSGYIEQVDQVTLKDIELLYKTLDKPLVFACGTLDENLELYLNTMNQRDTISSNYCLLSTFPFVEKRISKDIEQSYITKVYATQMDTKDSLYHSLVVLNSILGQSPVNFLFTEIREKHSYCYSIGSSLIRFDGALYVYCGCEKENIDVICDLIDQQIQRLIDMDYDDIYLENAKKDVIDNIQSSFDTEYSYIERSFISCYLNSDESIEKKIQEIQKVTKESVSICAKKLHALSLCIVQEESECTI
ncbi:insulinase family protein [Floccifex sp.]|uniref:insulinase family protein n=1 Tax=Floccifex sp. TaxID=2815810 RepID=UPI003F0A9BF6